MLALSDSCSTKLSYTADVVDLFLQFVVVEFHQAMRMAICMPTTVAFWNGSFFVDHLSRNSDDVVFNELLANVLNVWEMRN